jgi:GR25 family glycosyltransferase involved in LPS biosynthesis
MKCFLINLDKDIERYNNSMNQLKDFNIERISAIYGKDLNEEYIKKILSKRAYDNLGRERRDHFGIYTKGAIGCYLSHVQVWLEIVRRNLKYAIVFEDDIAKSKNYNLNAMNDQIRKSLQYCKNNNKKLSCIFFEVDERDSEKIDDNMYKLKEFFGTRCYLITNHGARQLLKDCFPLEVQVDNYMCIKARNDDLVMLYSKPFMFTTFCKGDTNIQTLCIDCIFYDNRRKFLIIFTLLFVTLFFLMWRGRKCIF